MRARATLLLILAAALCLGASKCDPNKLCPSGMQPTGELGEDGLPVCECREGLVPAPEGEVGCVDPAPPPTTQPSPPVTVPTPEPEPCGTPPGRICRDPDDCDCFRCERGSEPFKKATQG